MCRCRNIGVVFKSNSKNSLVDISNNELGNRFLLVLPASFVQGKFGTIESNQVVIMQYVQP
ncbi:hypothetical protein P886_1976 [Alteromonadaceae bacterium 2753L.S.0a.02]|nr:hypothetical protein P886_1976 [Alteromonadaceae bacterium 2753L.S.0a.02]